MKLLNTGDGAVNTHRQKYFQNGKLVSWACYDHEGGLVQWKPAADNPEDTGQHQQPAQESEQ